MSEESNRLGETSDPAKRTTLLRHSFCRPRRSLWMNRYLEPAHSGVKRVHDRDAFIYIHVSEIRLMTLKEGK